MTDLLPKAYLNDPAATEGQFQDGIGALYDFVAQLFAGSARDANTIATGTITPLKGFVIVDTEGAAATDNLDNILATNIGAKIIVIRATSAARVVTVRHNQTGAGQIGLLGATSAVLDSLSKILVLSYNSSTTSWEELWRSWGIYTPSAADKAAALTQIGAQAASTAALLAAVQVFVGAQRVSTTALTSTGGSVAIDFNANNEFTHTMTENTTLANPTNCVAGQSGSIKLTQHASAAKTLAFGSNFKFLTGTPVMSTTVGAFDTLYYSVRSPTFIECSYAKGWA